MRIDLKLSDRPWEEPTCTLIGLGRSIVMLNAGPLFRPCDACWGKRSQCGGMPRADGKASP